MNHQGYWVEDHVLTQNECDLLLEEVGHRRSRRNAGRRNLMKDGTLADLALDHRLLNIAHEALRSPAVPYRATLFDKSADANWCVAWHQDVFLPVATRFVSSQWGPWSKKGGVLFARAPAWALARVVALRIHLDPSTFDNGPLRVISGSHSLGVLTSDEVSKIARERNYVECAVPRGGVLAMKPLLIHSSPKAITTAPRRVLHIEYADSICLADDICLAAA